MKSCATQWDSRNTQYCFCAILAKDTPPKSNLQRIPRKAKRRDILQNDRPIPCKSIPFIRLEERWGKCARMKEIWDTYKQHAILNWTLLLQRRLLSQMARPWGWDGGNESGSRANGLLCRSLPVCKRVTIGIRRATWLSNGSEKKFCAVLALHFINFPVSFILFQNLKNFRTMSSWLDFGKTLLLTFISRW